MATFEEIGFELSAKDSGGARAVAKLSETLAKLDERTREYIRTELAARRESQSLAKQLRQTAAANEDYTRTLVQEALQQDQVIRQQERGSATLRALRVRYQRVKNEVRDFVTELSGQSKVVRGIQKTTNALNAQIEALDKLTGFDLTDAIDEWLGRFANMAEIVSGLTDAFNFLKDSVVNYIQSNFEAIKSTAANTTAMVRMAEQFGANIRFFSAFSAAAGDVGVSLSDVEGAIGDLQQRAANVPQDFERWGISVKDLDGDLVGMDELLLRLADRLSETSNETEQLAAATQLAGTSGRRLLPILKGGRQELLGYMQAMDEAGFSVDSVSAKISNELTTSLFRLENAFEAQRQAMTDTFGPQIIAGIKFVTDVIKQQTEDMRKNGDTWREWGARVIRAIAELIKMVPILVEQLGRLLLVLGLLTTALGLLTRNPLLAAKGAAIAAAGVAIGQVSDAMKGATQEAIKLADGFAQAIEQASKFEDTRTAMEKFREDMLTDKGIFGEVIREMERAKGTGGLLAENLDELKARYAQLRSEVKNLVTQLNALQGTAEKAIAAPEQFQAGPAQRPTPEFTGADEQSRILAQEIVVQRTRIARETADAEALAAQESAEQQRQIQTELILEIEQLRERALATRSNRQKERIQKEIEILTTRVEEETSLLQATQQAEETFIRRAIEAKKEEVEAIVSLEKMKQERILRIRGEQPGRPQGQTLEASASPDFAPGPLERPTINQDDPVEAAIDASARLASIREAADEEVAIVQGKLERVRQLEEQAQQELLALMAASQNLEGPSADQNAAEIEAMKEELARLQQHHEELLAAQSAKIERSIDLKRQEADALKELDKEIANSSREAAAEQVKNAQRTAGIIQSVAGSVVSSINQIIDIQKDQERTTEETGQAILQGTIQLVQALIPVLAAQAAASAGAQTAGQTGVAAIAAVPAVIAAMLAIFAGLASSFHVGGEVTEGLGAKRFKSDDLIKTGATEGLVKVQAGETIRTSAQEMKIQESLKKLASFERSRSTSSTTRQTFTDQVDTRIREITNTLTDRKSLESRSLSEQATTDSVSQSILRTMDRAEIAPAARFAMGQGFQAPDTQIPTALDSVLSSDPVSSTREQIFKSSFDTNRVFSEVRTEDFVPEVSLETLAMDAPERSVNLESLAIAGPGPSAPSISRQEPGTVASQGDENRPRSPETASRQTVENHYHFANNSYFPASFNDTVRQNEVVDSHLRFGATAHRTNRRR